MPPDALQPGKRKKKVDREALGSPFARIPGVSVEVARDLIDLGFREVFELAGRSPDALADELAAKRGGPGPDRRPDFRLAVYFAETPEPDRRLLDRHAWM